MKSIDDLAISDFLENVATKEPTPGGGAVASILTGLAAALTEMVVNYSSGKKKFIDSQAMYDELMTWLPGARSSAGMLAEADAAAYAKLNEIQLKMDPPEEHPEWETAVAQAIAMPSACLDLSMEVLEKCEQLVGRSNDWLKSDLAIAAIIAEAAVASAAWNIRINLPLLPDQNTADTIANGTRESVEKARQLRDQIEAAC